MSDTTSSTPDAGGDAMMQPDTSTSMDGGTDALGPSWCKTNYPDARVCDDYERAIGDYASRGWTVQRVDPGAHFDLVTDKPVSAPNAGRFTTDPVSGNQVFAIDSHVYPDGGINRIVVEMSFRIRIHDPGGDSPIITQGFTTSSGDHFFVVRLRQNDVTAATFYGANWTFPSTVLDGNWHTLRIVMQRGDGGIGVAITSDGQLLTAMVGDSGTVNPIGAFLDPTGIEVGMHSFQGTGTRQVDLDNVVVSY